MIDLETVEREIEKLEHCSESYRRCELLASMYVLRDHMRPTPGIVSATVVRVVPEMGGSDFLSAASGKSVEDVLKVVDEHLQTIKLMYPKTYGGILDRIREL